MKRIGTRRKLALLVASLGLLVAVGGPGPAVAAFPGTNGKIVYVSDVDGGSGIWVMNPDGSGVTQLTSGTDGDPQWSPDGTRIAFASADDVGDVYVMNADGSGRTRLTQEGFDAQAPSWSPDGQRIAFDHGGSSPEVWVMNADGGDPARLVTHGALPAWSPDGQTIAFYGSFGGGAGDNDGIGEIYLMDADGSSVRQLTVYFVDQDRPIPDGEAPPSWSPDGTKLVFSGTSSQSELTSQLWVINADGTEEHRLTTNLGNVQYRAPAWSPDGQKIAFFANLDCCLPPLDVDSELFGMNADGSGITRLTDNDTGDAFPDWQPLPASPGGGDVVVTSCADLADLADLKEVDGDLVIDAVAGCSSISLPSLESVDGDLTITNTDAMVIDLSSLATTGGSVTITDNSSAQAIDVGSLTSSTGTVDISGNTAAQTIDAGSLATTGGSVTITDNSSAQTIDVGSLTSSTGTVDISDNGSTTVVDLGSLGSVSGDLSLETAGDVVDASGAAVGGDTTIVANGSSSVSAQTAGGTTDVSVLGGTASMHVVLPDGTFDQPVAFTIERQGDAPAEPGKSADGGITKIDPVGGHRFTFDVPTLGVDAQLAFTVDLSQLDSDTRTALLDGVADGSAGLVVKGDEADATYQAFARCADGQTPTAGGCVTITLLDAAGSVVQDTAAAASVHFDGVAGHFSTYAVALIEAATPTDTTPPTITVPQDIAVDATGPDGAQVTYRATATDELDPSPSLSCTPGSGSTFPTGDTTVICGTSDASGNSATARFTIHVRGGSEQIVRLIDKTLAFLDRPALAPTLRARLQAAADAVTTNHPREACLALHLYVGAVKLAPRRVLSSSEKAELITDATRIEAVLGCR